MPRVCSRPNRRTGRSATSGSRAAWSPPASRRRSLPSEFPKFLTAGPTAAGRSRAGMIHTSKLHTIRVLFAAALAVAGCSGTSGGQIPCVDDVSCPNDYAVCGPAGKCIAGTATGNVSVAIVGAAGKQAGDPVRGAISIQVAARSTSGIKSLSLAGGGKTFAPAAGASGPVYDIAVDTTTLAEGSVSFKATATPGDPSVQPVDSTGFALTVDNAAPVLTSSATIGPVALGSLVTLDVTATEALSTLTANVLLLGDII